MAKELNEYMSIRLEKTLKENFEAFCESCGITVSGAISMLVKHTINEQKIPFRISATPEVMGIHEGGKKQIERISIRIDKEHREEFSKVCKHIGVPMGRIVKMFMANCLNNGKLPF